MASMKKAVILLVSLALLFLVYTRLPWGIFFDGPEDFANGIEGYSEGPPFNQIDLSDKRFSLVTVDGERWLRVTGPARLYAIDQPILFPGTNYEIKANVRVISTGSAKEVPVVVGYMDGETLHPYAFNNMVVAGGVAYAQATIKAPYGRIRLFVFVNGDVPDAVSDISYLTIRPIR